MTPTRKSSNSLAKEQMRLAAEADLETFIQLVSPGRALSQCHQDIIRWWQREDAKTHQLLLMPRDHGKSWLVAYRVAHRIAKDPIVRIIYLSATARLAEKQLDFIKGILTSDKFRYYWPQHVNEKESDRELWRKDEIKIDHPLRKQEDIRDSTVLAGGLTMSLTGLHCDVAVYDDLVVYDNAYNESGREQVRRQYSLLNSVAGAHSEQWAVGTRYDPNDLYNDMASAEYDIYDEHGDVVGKNKVYEVWEKAVENVGDGTGEYLWPRTQRADGQWFGFNKEILAIKRATYLDQRQFRAQYYNNPNLSDEEAIPRRFFQYYDKKFLRRDQGRWFFKDEHLNIVAAMDFAYTEGQRSDYTALAVIGMTKDRDIYVLAMRRFKTKSMQKYYEAIVETFNTWGYRKLRAEATAAQSVIIEELKTQYIRPNGLNLSVESVKHTSKQGTKEERIHNTLYPRYENLQIWHERGGYAVLLEEELMSASPTHDDLKDALAAAVDCASPPAGYFSKASAPRVNRHYSAPTFHGRFGGVAH